MLTRRSSWIAARTWPSFTRAAPAVCSSLIPRVTTEVMAGLTARPGTDRSLGLLPPLLAHDAGRCVLSRPFPALFAQTHLQRLCRQEAAHTLPQPVPRYPPRAALAQYRTTLVFPRTAVTRYKLRRPRARRDGMLRTRRQSCGCFSGRS